MLASGLAATLLGGAAPVGQLDVTIGALRSTQGVLRVCLTRDPANFPKCVDDANATRRNVAPAQGGVRFEGLPAGQYALAVIHDENGNHRLDTLAGIPREGFGFSRNPGIRFGPPRFSAARFPIAGDTARQQVRMRYML